jgi:hypothetical protein
METIDGNKLIADFEKLETPDGIYYEYLTKDGNRSKLTHFILLEYHLCWKWIIPVVQTIKDTPTRVSLDGIDFVLTCDLTIENLYEEVVEFIKEYNEEKKLKTI